MPAQSGGLLKAMVLSPGTDRQPSGLLFPTPFSPNQPRVSSRPLLRRTTHIRPTESGVGSTRPRDHSSWLLRGVSAKIATSAPTCDGSSGSGLLDYEAAARYLCTTARHVRELWARRELAAIKVGRSVRFTKADLDAFIEARHAVR